MSVRTSRAENNFAPPVFIDGRCALSCERDGSQPGAPAGIREDTDAAFNTADGKKTLADLQKRNGTALDGTPIIKTLSELENLFSKGFAAKRFRNPNGSEGPMYGICPVVKDPKNGGIPLDTTLSFVRKPDGTPLEPYFVTNFDSLKFTLDWAKN